MSLSALIWGQSQFDEAVDKATSELRLAEEDIALNLEICDQIRSKSVPTKDAIRALKKRLNHKNPNVQLLSLGLIDTCVKNGGDPFLNELASREFMDNMVSLLKMRDLNIDVKNKMLRLIQNWSIAFEGKHTLGYVGQVYRDLKAEGFVFPPKDLTVSGSAMIDTATAPEWIDSDVCLRCRTAFTFTNRKHHCRNCGRVFDQTCSSKSLPLPHFGINQEVRVCDGCHTKLTKATRRKESSKSVDFSSGSHQRHPSSSRKHRSERGFDADLQRAIELSLAESGVSNKPSYNQWQASEPPLVDRTPRRSARSSHEEEDDPELRAAIEASLREANAPKPSAPVVTPYGERGEYSFRDRSSYVDGYATETPIPVPVALPKVPQNDLGPRESDDIMTFSQAVQDAQAQGGSGLSRIPNVNELYDRANSLRPKLAVSLDETGRKEQMLSEMHEKLSEAVKLYDNLLTQRIAHHTWRSTSSPQQIYGGVYSQAPPANVSQRTSMNDWTSQVNTVSNERSMNYESVPAPPIRPVMERQASYTEYGAHLHSQHNMHPQQQTSNPNWASPAAYTSPPPPSHEQWPAERYHGALSQTTASPSVPQHFASPVPLAHQSSPPQSYRQPAQTSVSQTYGQPIQSPPPPQSVQPYQPPVQSPPPIVQPQQYAPVGAPPVQPFVLPQSPPQQAYHQTPSASLSRHNSLSHSPYVTSPKTTLARSNTVASSSSHVHSHNGYNAPNSLQNAGLPAFPSVPKSEPAPFYTPSGFEQTEEKKEALLIDL